MLHVSAVTHFHMLMYMCDICMAHNVADDTASYCASHSLIGNHKLYVGCCRSHGLSGKSQFSRADRASDASCITAEG